MQIRRISLENFQCYYGKLSENTFTFSKGVNIITGNNGSGKSKLFNAFHWVLFGNIFSQNEWTTSKKLGHSFISNRAKSLAEEGERVTCSVELSLSGTDVNALYDTVEYTFSRRVAIQRIGTEWKIVKPEKLDISFKKPNGETEFVALTDNERVISHIFPPALRKYMWFQGEAIDSLIDFDNPNTLKKAIKNISYYPFYERIHRISRFANESLSKSINKHLRKSNKNDTKLKQIISKIESDERTLNSLEEDLQDDKSKLEDIKESIVKTERQLKNYDGYRDFERKLNDIERKEREAKYNIETLEQNYREKLVTKWMLKGIEPLLAKAEGVLDEFQSVIREKSESDNPIPLKVPGKKYIKTMLNDECCHICERSAQKGTPAYNAIKKRLGESEVEEEEAKQKQHFYNQLESTHMTLTNKPDEVRDFISTTASEISEWDRKTRELFEIRQQCRREREELEADNQISDIIQGAKTAKTLTSDLIYYKDEEKKVSQLVRRNESQMIALKDEIKRLKEERRKFEGKDEPIKEQKAETYFKHLEIILGELKERALHSLIKNIESKANDLYKKYLVHSQSPDGYLNIDPETYEVLVLDNGKRKDINQGHETAAKMSVINAILYLSSEKLGKSYPLVADAPSSVFDKANTQSYTEKIDQTFEQVIIISKDYSTPDELEFLKRIDSITKVYKIENHPVDNTIEKSETNNKTFVELIKEG